MGRLINGFTLMELMVTMAILAVIAGIAIPSYKGYMHNSYLTECQNEIAAMKIAQEEFFLENNAYFPSPVGTVTSDNTQITAIENASNNLYTSGYTVRGNAARTTANLAKANCTFSVTSNAGPGYTIAVTGVNNLNATDNFTFVK